MRAGWRALLFIALVIALVFATGWIMARLPALPRLQAGGRISPAFMLAGEFVLLLPVMLATWLMTWLEGRGFATAGLEGPRGPRLLAWGMAGGVVLISALVLALAGLGFAAMGQGGLGPEAAAGYALGWLGAALLVGFSEEFTFRGYLLQALARGLGFWPAAFLTSLAFAAMHVFNTGESFIGLAQLFLVGLLLCLGIKLTSSLWWSIGLHAGWDYAENFIFGTHDSGQACLGALLDTLPRGADWLSGGVTGPEGSALGLLIPPLAALALWPLRRRLTGIKAGA